MDPWEIYLEIFHCKYIVQRTISLSFLLLLLLSIFSMISRPATKEYSATLSSVSRLCLSYAVWIEHDILGKKYIYLIKAYYAKLPKEM